MKIFRNLKFTHVNDKSKVTILDISKKTLKEMKKVGKTEDVYLEIEGEFYKIQRWNFKDKNVMMIACSSCGVYHKCLERNKRYSERCLAEKIKSFSSDQKLFFHILKKIEAYEAVFMDDSYDEFRGE